MARKRKGSGHKMRVGTPVGKRKHSKHGGFHYHAAGVKHSGYKAPVLHTR